MFLKIEKHLKDRLKDIVFVELKEDAELKISNCIIDSNTPLPILLEDIVDKVKGNDVDDFKLKQIIQGMVFIIGIDKDFKYNKEYKNFLENVDDNIVNNIINQGIIYLDNKQKIDGLICFKAALYLDNNDLNGLYNYARCCEEISIDSEEDSINKDFEDEAKEIFEKITEEYPKFSLAYYHLGFHYANMKLFKKAEVTWERALENGIDDNRRMEILNRLTDLKDNLQYEEGYTLILNNKAEQGLTKLKPLEEKYSDWWNLLFFIGLAHRNLNDFINAIEYFKRVIRLKSGQVDSYNEIGLCYISLGDTENAIKYFNKALKIKGEDPELFCNMGIAYLNRGDIEKAEIFIRKAYELDPEDQVTRAWIQRLELSI